MATSTTTTSSSISTITGYAVVAEAQVGSNGAPGSTAEYDVGTPGQDALTGRMTWDSDLTDGLDSGWVSVELDANPGGGSNGDVWTVTGGVTVPLTYTLASYGSIQKVQIRAAVQTAAAMSWRSVSVQFYKSGVVTDSLTLRTGPAVNTSTQSPPVAKQQILEVTPAATDNDKVVITGQIRLTCPATTLPGPEDIFGQIFVFAD